MKDIRAPLLVSLIGALIGYFVLHPGVMITSAFMRGNISYGAVKAGFSMALEPRMAPWATAFFLFGAIIGFLVWRVRSDVRRLEEAKELRRLFGDMIAHDISNPLTAAMMRTEILQDKIESDEGKNDLQEVMARLDDAEAILRKAREFTQVEDVNELEYEQMDLGHLIEEAVEGLRPLAVGKGIDLNCECSLLPIHVNPKIEMVFSNILSNAIKYSPAESRVEIEIQDLGDKVRVLTKDQGEGIPHEHKDGVFDRHRRVQREGVKGTGLGLAITKKLVDLHHGKVWVEDNIPKGSIFIVELPKKQK